MGRTGRRLLVAQRHAQKLVNRPPKDVRSDLIRLRVTMAEKATLTTAAKLAELDVSEWLRSLGLREAAKRSVAAEK